MIIMESAIAMNNDYIECTNALEKISLFAEASYKEYDINIKEATLKVLKENGTNEDFDFLATEASVCYIERAKKSIEKIIEAVKKFIRNCKDKLIALVTHDKTKLAIDKVEEACKSNPKLKSFKVEYQDTDKQVSILQQGIDKIRKKVSKIKANGIATAEDIDEINKIEEDTMKKVAAISIVTAATLGTAIAIFKHCSSKTEVEAILDANSISDCDITFTEDNTKSAETAAAYTTAAGSIAKLKKEAVTKKIIKQTSIFNAIKTGIANFKENKTSNPLKKQTNESVLENLRMFAVITEAKKSDNDETDEVKEEPDVDEYFDNLCEELFSDKSSDDEQPTESNEKEDNDDDKPDDAKDTKTETEEIASESTNETTDNAQLYMEQLECELFGDNEEVATESTTESLLDVMESLL